MRAIADGRKPDRMKRTPSRASDPSVTTDAGTLDFGGLPWVVNTIDMGAHEAQ